MLIGDGVTPGNEGRGYVLRRLLRRAVRSMRLLGYEDRALPELLPGQPRQDGRDLRRAAPRLGAHLDRSPTPRRTPSGRPCAPAPRSSTRPPREVQARGRHACCPASKAFALHDTYGFPIDLTLEMAAEQGLAVDEVGFRQLMDRAARAGQGGRAGQEGRARRHRGLPRGRRRARARRSSSPATARSSPRARCAASSAAGGVVDSAREGDEVELVLDRTPFYAEGGGQLADQGVIELDNGARVEVRDVQSPITGLVVHTAQGAQRRGDRRAARPRRSVDIERRKSISPRPHRDPHGAQGVPRGARRDRDPGGLGERARPVPLRLLRDRRRARRR